MGCLKGVLVSLRRALIKSAGVSMDRCVGGYLGEGPSGEKTIGAGFAGAVRVPSVKGTIVSLKERMMSYDCRRTARVF